MNGDYVARSQKAAEVCLMLSFFYYHTVLSVTVWLVVLMCCLSQLSHHTLILFNTDLAVRNLQLSFRICNFLPPPTLLPTTPLVACAAQLHFKCYDINTLSV